MKNGHKKTITDYRDLMFHADIPAQRRVLIGVPMTGVLRAEWTFARLGQIIPCNWSCSDTVHFLPQCSPIGYAVAEARNAIVKTAIEQNFEWLLFIDHDVIMPRDCFVRIDEYLKDGSIPVVSGLYFAKAHPPSPLVYRGRGNSSYDKWRMGDKVWVDGIPMGLTLINVKVLRLMWEDAEEYVAGGNQKVRRVFDTPSGVLIDPEKQDFNVFGGTEDLTWCNRVMAGKYLKKAGFEKIGAQKYPFLLDTNLFCKHMTLDGDIYPRGFQELERSLLQRQARERA